MTACAVEAFLFLRSSCHHRSLRPVPTARLLGPCYLLQSDNTRGNSFVIPPDNTTFVVVIPRSVIGPANPHSSAHPESAQCTCSSQQEGLGKGFPVSTKCLRSNPAVWAASGKVQRPVESAACTGGYRVLRQYDGITTSWPSWAGVADSSPVSHASCNPIT
jgi:hypothetical protein